MKLYVVVESGNFDSDGDTAVLGATRYKNDAIKYAAECNDNNLMNYEDRTCRVQEFESEDINTKSNVMPLIKYSIVFGSNGKLLNVIDSSYTYNECINVHYKKLSKCYVMDITLDYSVPESTVKQIAQIKMCEFLKDNKCIPIRCNGNWNCPICGYPAMRISGKMKKYCDECGTNLQGSTGDDNSNE